MEIIYTILCILCLGTGFYFGLKLGKGEKVETPVEKVKEVKEKVKKDKREEQEARKIEKEIEKFNTVLENIASYPDNQKEVE